MGLGELLNRLNQKHCQNSRPNYGPEIGPLFKTCSLFYNYSHRRSHVYERVYLHNMYILRTHIVLTRVYMRCALIIISSDDFYPHISISVLYCDMIMYGSPTDVVVIINERKLGC